MPYQFPLPGNLRYLVPVVRETSKVQSGKVFRVNAKLETATSLRQTMATIHVAAPYGVLPLQHAEGPFRFTKVMFLIALEGLLVNLSKPP